MYGNLEVSVSGLIAQRTRLNTIAANIANRDAILDADGNYNPYRRRFTIFEAGNPSASSEAGRGQGVHVSAIELDESELLKRWEPNSPYAQPPGTPDAGYVYYPNIDTATEMVDGLDAQRAYEANIAAAEATKAIVAQALRLLS
jgi:flagellar basal-body rod protein FlgC